MGEFGIWIIIAIIAGISKVVEGFAKKRRGLGQGPKSRYTPPSSAGKTKAKPQQSSDFEMFIQEMKAQRKRDATGQAAPPAMPQSPMVSKAPAPVAKAPAHRPAPVPQQAVARRAQPAKPPPIMDAILKAVTQRASPVKRVTAQRPKQPQPVKKQKEHQHARIDIPRQKRKPARPAKSSGGIPLPSHLTPLQQAVLYMEILGPPKALQGMDPGLGR